MVSRRGSYCVERAQSQKGKAHRASSALTPSLDDAASLQDTTSPHNTLTERDVRALKMNRPGKKLSDIWSGFVKSGESSDKQDQLTELLNSYSSNGLPSLDSIVNVGVESYSEDAFHVEKHWSEIVANAEGLSKKQRNQQTRIWELLHTEVEYIQKLKVIIDLFMCVLLNLQKEILLNDIDTDKIFSNITAVYNANRRFWVEHMGGMLKHSRKTGQALDPSFLKDGFSKFEEIFKSYTKYCFEQNPCQEYIKQRYRDNDLFRIYVAWAEAQKQCNRLKLADLLVTPMHRLTRYKLLLAAIHKETTDDTQKKDVLHMISAVERFVLQVNTFMHQEQERARLSRIIDRIEDYQAVEVPNDECAKLIKDLNRLDLTRPVPGCGPHQKRHLLKECSFRLKETTASKTDVHCFLFTDLLLITKHNTKKGSDKVRVIKPPMRLDKIVVQPLNDQTSFLLIHLNEYHLASAAYTLHGDHARLWAEEIRKAQEAYREMRRAALDHSESRIAYLNSVLGDDDDEYSADFNSVSSGATPRPEHSPDYSLMQRIDSNSSVDSFLPNLSMMPRSSSQDMIHRAAAAAQAGGDPYALDRTLSLDDRATLNTPKRLRSVTVGAYGANGGGERGSEKGSPRNLSVSHSQEGSIDETQYLSPSTSPGTNEVNIAEDFKSGLVRPKTKPIIRSDSQSSGESSGSSSQQHPVLAQAPPHGQNLALSNCMDPNLDESVKVKLAHRRILGNRRYHTADAIQELRKDKDASIHKRLSWNLGHAVEISIDGERQGILKNKAFSNDSLRSMPSSSGVSSTGSLHLSPESEICEEYETPELEFSEHGPPPALPDLPPPVPENQVLLGHALMKQSFDEDDAIIPGDADASSTTPLGGTQDRSMSKSLPDLSAMLKSEVRDGIGSIQLSSPESTSPAGQRRKMTQAQIWKMTALLLNSTLEASEV